MKVMFVRRVPLCHVTQGVSPLKNKPDRFENRSGCVNSSAKVMMRETLRSEMV